MDAVLFKAAARGREVQEKREAERRRALLVLVLRHLTDHGYCDAAERLSTEANVSLARQDAADNVSLLHILQDYEEAQEQRYGRRPKLVKQLTCEVRNSSSSRSVPEL
jgi:katanin p60 ATPase-containing subunit A1